MAETTPQASPKAPAKASQGSGLEPNISGLLSWLLAPITSIIFLVIEKDEDAKFHAWESLIWTLASNIIVFVVYTILSVVTFGIGSCCFPMLFLPYVVNVIGAIKAYNGERWKLPVIGDFSEEQAKK